MDLLLDTHAFIWFFNGDDNLSTTVKKLIEDPTSKCWISIASLWEISIKTSIGKLALRGDFAEIEGFMATGAIGLLPISFEHLLKLQHLPFHHRDPFDRLIIAQALTEELTLLSRDAVFQQYEVSLKWRKAYLRFSTGLKWSPGCIFAAYYLSYLALFPPRCGQL